MAPCDKMFRIGLITSFFVNNVDNVDVDVNVAQLIAQKTTVREDLGSIPCSADGFSCENI
jgi:hypothetical protein